MVVSVDEFWLNLSLMILLHVNSERPGLIHEAVVEPLRLDGDEPTGAGLHAGAQGSRDRDHRLITRATGRALKSRCTMISVHEISSMMI